MQSRRTLGVPVTDFGLLGDPEGNLALLRIKLGDSQLTGYLIRLSRACRRWAFSGPLESSAPCVLHGGQGSVSGVWHWAVGPPGFMGFLS